VLTTVTIFGTTYIKHASCSLDVEALKEWADEVADKQKLLLCFHDWLQLIFHETKKRLNAVFQ